MLRRLLVMVCSVSMLTVVSHSVFAVSDKPVEPAARQVAKAQKEQINKVNINTADVATLQKAKYMSKRKAESIVKYREANGPFKSVDDLLKVKCRGIHKDWLEKASKHFEV